MAKLAAVATVCGNRGPVAGHRRDQPSSPRSRSHSKDDPQGDTRAGDGNALSARGADTQARWRKEEEHAKDATLRADLEGMLEPRGDPQSLLRWTSKSVSKLRGALTSQGHVIGETAIRRMLKAMGFSLKATKKGTLPTKVARKGD